MVVAAGISLFIVAMIICLALNVSMIYAMVFGLAIFYALGRRMGYKFATLTRMSLRKCAKALIVWRVFFYIGMMTGLWRASGTVAYVIVNCIGIIPPSLFVLASFLLSAVMSMMIGTSFGVTSTVGVMLIAIARSGGVNELVVAGAVISGAFFGDRCSPASSCASLIAAITGTNLYTNIKQLLKTAAIPTAVILIAYGILSKLNPISSINESLLLSLQDHFDLSLWVLAPAILMLVLPLCRVPVRIAMGASVLSSLILTIVLQHIPVWDALKIAVMGYQPSGELSGVLSGGGLISMADAAVIVMLTSCYSGIIEGTDMLKNVSEVLTKLSSRLGVFVTMAMVSLVYSMIFCNQTIVVMLDQQLLQPAYDRIGASREEMAIDISNSGMIMAGLIPWSIAVAIPLSMLGVGAGALPYALLLYVLPVCYGLTKRLFYPRPKPVIAKP